jgi:hypothetical protein
VILKKLLKSNFVVRLTHWEYWPFWAVQFPFLLYWLWLSLRARSLFFFSASNPTIANGGMFGESKYDVLNLVPERYRPRTILIRYPVTEKQLLEIVSENNFHFPLIFKPDIGERGFMVKKIEDVQSAVNYLKKIKVDFLIQEFIDLPLECGVFYTRFPYEANGRVTSLTLKEMLTVTGNGQSTVEELILEKPRAKLQYETLKAQFNGQLRHVLNQGDVLELNGIGNHCLGTKFLNGQHLITDKLSRTFDAISQQVSGFYFGRYDLRCASLDDLYNGNVMVMELNGCGAEPAHIYEPGFSLWKAFGVLQAHWKTLYTISVYNHKLGVQYMPFKEGRKLLKAYRAALQ